MQTIIKSVVPLGAADRYMGIYARTNMFIYMYICRHTGTFTLSQHAQTPRETMGGGASVSSKTVRQIMSEKC